MTEKAIRFEGLGHAYHSDRWVFRRYSASIERGRVFAILGPNGRGKSTLLHILLGALRPTEGSVETNGRLAFVPQLFQVTFDYSVLDMVLMGRARTVRLFSQPSEQDETLAMAALARFGLAAFAHAPFHELSGGQRQLAIIARALVSQSDILVLDEPTSALDMKNQALVLDWIERLASEDGITVVFTTHQPHHALAVSQDALLMLDEAEFACGPAAEVLTEARLTALYGIPLRLLTFAHGGISHSAVVPVLARRPAES